MAHRGLSRIAGASSWPHFRISGYISRHKTLLPERYCPERYNYRGAVGCFHINAADDKYA
jgi:hypothetical protein